MVNAIVVFSTVRRFIFARTNCLMIGAAQNGPEWPCLKSPLAIQLPSFVAFTCMWRSSAHYLILESFQQFWRASPKIAWATEHFWPVFLELFLSSSLRSFISDYLFWRTQDVPVIYSLHKSILGIPFSNVLVWIALLFNMCFWLAQSLGFRKLLVLLQVDIDLADSSKNDKKRILGMHPLSLCCPVGMVLGYNFRGKYLYSDSRLFKDRHQRTNVAFEDDFQNPFMYYIVLFKSVTNSAKSSFFLAEVRFTSLGFTLRPWAFKINTKTDLCGTSCHKA